MGVQGFAGDTCLEEREGWCGRGDLNPYGSLRQILSLVRLPISPLPQVRLLYCDTVGKCVSF